MKLANRNALWIAGGLALMAGPILQPVLAGPLRADETARADVSRSWARGWEQINRGQFDHAVDTFRDAVRDHKTDPVLSTVTGWLEEYETLQREREELRAEEFELFVRRAEEELIRLNLQPLARKLAGGLLDRWIGDEERLQIEAGLLDEDGNPVEAEKPDSLSRDEDDEGKSLWRLMRKRIPARRTEETPDERLWEEKIRDGVRGGVALVYERFDGARWVDALDEARYAFLNAQDQQAFKHGQWMTALANRSLAIAAQKKHEEKWIDASGIYYELELIYDQSPEFKKLRRDCQTHARLEAIYARNEDWKKMIRGVEPEIVSQALKRIGTNYVREADFRGVVRHGLESVLLIARTPALRDTFDGLDDDLDREMFVSRIESRLARLENERQVTAKTAIRHYWKKLLDINRSTVQLPVGVLCYEFMEGALQPLDEFSSVIWPQQVADFRKYTVGRFSGVGIQINIQAGSITVFTPLEGTPAYRAGIRPGDVIVKIDGIDATKISLDDAVERITGPSGTDVTLTVLHEGEDEEVDLTMTRESIQLETVKGVQRKADGVNWNYMADPDERIAYIRISSFTDKTTADLREALEHIESEGARGLILDLRFNPGGLLTAAWEMADLLLPGDRVILKTAGDHSKDWEKRSTAAHTELPLIVLINDRSASASEIVSGAVKDHERGLIIGERSFGKGSVQNLIALTDNEALLKLTTAHYFLPSGRCLQREDDSLAWGVEPDLEVRLTPREVRYVRTTRRDADIISNGEQSANDAAIEEPDSRASDAQFETAMLLMRVRLTGQSEWLFPDRPAIADAGVPNDETVTSN